MEFRDLKMQYQVLKKQIDEAMVDVATTGAYIMGEQVKELEAELASYVNVKHCITCANGTDALTMALMAWGVREGDAIFVPDFTFFASAEVVSYEGATPVFVDVDPDTYNMDPVELEEAVNQVIAEGRLIPRVIISVDLFGLPANYKEINKIAQKYKLRILEDGAQGFGGSIKGKRVCSFGDISTTSFFPAKPLGCYGDGGAIFTDNEEWADYIRSIKVHGKGSYKYDNIRIGLNSRLDTLQAAILIIKFRAFKSYELNDINEVAKKYTDRLKDIVKTPIIPDSFSSSWAQYTITLSDNKERDGLQAYLKEKGIPSMVYYPKPLHLQTAYKEHGQNMGDLPITEILCNRVLSLPIHPYMSNDDIDKVCNSINEYIL